MQAGDRMMLPALDDPPSATVPADLGALARTARRKSHRPADLPPRTALESHKFFSTHGTDSRHAVDPAGRPWGAICQILAEGELGISRGTGFVISPSWIMTAAHVFEGIGGPNLEIEARFPAGGSHLAQRSIYEPYRSGGAEGDDIALLRVSREALAAVSGYIDLSLSDDAFLQAYIRQKSPAVVPGFPHDREGLVSGHGPLTAFTGKTIAHVADTEQRQSGAPLLYMTRTSARALGVHGRGDRLGRIPPQEPNLAARITADVRDWAGRLIAHYGA